MATYTYYGDSSSLFVDLIDYFSMEEASSARFSQTDSRYYLTPSNTVAQFHPGKIGDGVQLTGATGGSQGKLVSNRSYDLHGDRTIAFWINVQTPALGVRWHAISFGSTYTLDVFNTAGQLAFVPTYNGSDLTSTIGTFGAWAHIVMVMSGTAGTIKFYFNGSFFNTSNITQIDAKQALTLQGSTQGTTTINLDEVAIWYRALSSTEISTLYSNTLAYPFGNTFYANPDPAYLGDSATVAIGYTASGGAIGGGSAIAGKLYNQTTTGQGAVAGGSAQVSISFIPSGGAIGGGSGTLLYVANPSTTGNGAICGGSASVQDTITIITTGQGAVAGGSAQLSLGYLPSGGAIGGGSAAISYNYVTLGGVVAGGSADVIDAVYVMSGGAIGGGSADVSGSIYRTGSSGMIVGGRGGQPKGFTGSSGFLMGGHGATSFGFFGKNGCKMGGHGTASFALNAVGSSGIIMAFDPLPWLYRKTVTIPAGKATADLTGFDVHVVCVIPPNHL